MSFWVEYIMEDDNGKSAGFESRINPVIALPVVFVLSVAFWAGAAWIATKIFEVIG